MTERETGNARAVIVSIDGDVIRLQRCAKVFIALGLGDHAVAEPPELEMVYDDNVLPFLVHARRMRNGR